MGICKTTFAQLLSIRAFSLDGELSKCIIDCSAASTQPFYPIVSGRGRPPAHTAKPKSAFRCVLVCTRVGRYTSDRFHRVIFSSASKYFMSRSFVSMSTCHLHDGENYRFLLIRLKLCARARRPLEPSTFHLPCTLIKQMFRTFAKQMDSAHPKGQFPMPRSVMLKHPRILWKRGESSKPSDEVGKMQRSNDEDAPSSGGELAELRQLSQRLEKEVSTG